MRDALPRLCEAAALATDTTVEVTFSGGARTMRNNGVLAGRFRANMAAYGIADQGDDLNAGSTDMANVSWVCPTIHPDLAIAPEGTPGHSILFRDAAISPRADETTLLAATLVAQTALELFHDPALVAAAWAEFRAELSRNRRSRHGRAGRGRRQRRVLPSPWRVPLDDGFEPAAPPSETDRSARPHPPRPSPEDIRG